MKITPLHAWIAHRIGCAPAALDRSRIEQYQLEHLNGLMENLRAHSPFYKERLASFPTRLNRLEELAGLPFTSADDLRRNPNRFACVSQDEIQRIVTLPTSGTTGESKRIFFTAEDLELTLDFFKVGMSTLANAGDRVLILLPGVRPDSLGDLLKRALERLGCLPVLYGPLDDEERVFQTIIDHEINVIVGAPVHLLRLARLDDADWVLPKNQIQKVLTSTDVLPDAIRSALQSLWGCEVFDHWGMTETGLGGGVECEAHQGFHLREADLLVEIIDPISGKVLPEGGMGEVVITTLTRAGMPLLRYRTGDLSRLIPGECACGSCIRRLDKITKRVDAGIPLGAHILTLHDLDEALFQIPEMLDFSAIIHDNGEMKTLSLALRSLPILQSELEFQVFNSLEKIPTLQSALSDGSLELEISPHEQIRPENPNAMQKRRLMIG